MNDELREKLKYLRLPALLTQWQATLKHACDADLSPQQLLEYVIDQEVAQKQVNARERRLGQAKIPEAWMMQSFPFDRQPNLNKKKLLTLYQSFEYVTRHQNILWIGPTGTGKSGLATAFLIQAIHQGYRGRFILFPELIEMLYQSMADHSQDKVIKMFAAYDCLLIDELGYVEMEPSQVGLFFTLMHKRHKRKCTLITSNLGFQQWNSFLKNDQLTAALIDRLTENSHIINMKKCVSLRSPLE